MSDDTRRTVFVLGGGGLLGASEVGMLRALLEHGIEPDLVLGTSVGTSVATSVGIDTDGVGTVAPTPAVVVPAGDEPPATAASEPLLPHPPTTQSNPPRATAPMILVPIMTSPSRWEHQIGKP